MKRSRTRENPSGSGRKMQPKWMLQSSYHITEPVSLDELLEKAEVPRAERMKIKDQEAL